MRFKHKCIAVRAFIEKILSCVYFHEYTYIPIPIDYEIRARINETANCIA